MDWISLEQQSFLRLGIALALGAMVGVERGWRSRDAEEGSRVAGVRTYTLLGLYGGVSGLLSEYSGAWVLGASFLGIAALVIVAYLRNPQRADDVGITSAVATLMVFGLGALAALGGDTLAIAAAVVTTLVLGVKPVLHRWVATLEGAELQAAIKLLLISAVLLPILPDQGYGPWQSLNPYQIWWMVVLIAAISFVGYFAFKLGGARRGALFAGVCGGLASSTALTLHLSRLARSDSSLAPALAPGVLFACGTMLPRMLVVVALINHQLLPPLLPAASVMAAIIYGTALSLLWTKSSSPSESSAALRNPLDIKSALAFGLLLAVVTVAGKAVQQWVGDAGVWALSAASGIADVDAITLSLARMSKGELNLQVATLGILFAAASNTAIKAAMTIVIGGKGIGLRAGLPLVGGAAAGLLTAWALF